MRRGLLGGLIVGALLAQAPAPGHAQDAYTIEVPQVFRNDVARTLPAAVGADGRVGVLRTTPYFRASVRLFLWNGSGWLFATGAAGAPIAPPGSVIDARAQNTMSSAFAAAIQGCAGPGSINIAFFEPGSDVGLERREQIDRDALRVHSELRVRPVAGADREYAVELQVPIQRAPGDPDPLKLRFVFPNTRFASPHEFEIVLAPQISFIGCAVGRLISPEALPPR